MAVTMREVKFSRLSGEEISINDTKDGYPVKVAGIVTKNGKKCFVTFKVTNENGTFYTEKGIKVKMA